MDYGIETVIATVTFDLKGLLGLDPNIRKVPIQLYSPCCYKLYV